MKRIYHPYEIWEDYLNGMYEYVFIDTQNEINLIDQSIELLSNQDRFFKVGIDLINDWIISSEYNLSNKSFNRQAWIGQASCCYNHKCPEILTRKAWSIMSLFDKYQANKTADRLIKIYEAKNKKIHTGVGDGLLF